MTNTSTTVPTTEEQALAEPAGKIIYDAEVGMNLRAHVLRTWKGFSLNIFHAGSEQYTGYTPFVTGINAINTARAMNRAWCAAPGSTLADLRAAREAVERVAAQAVPEIIDAREVMGRGLAAANNFPANDFTTGGLTFSRILTDEEWDEFVAANKTGAACLVRYEYGATFYRKLD